jgi:hypothetical protein
LERGDASGTPWGLRWIERFISVSYRSVRRNHALLAELSKLEDVAHDSVEYERLRAASLRLDQSRSAPVVGDRRAQ